MTPIRTKFLLAEHIAQVIKNLHFGKKEPIPPLLHEMATLAASLDEKVQKDIKEFSLQVEFQMDYDPFHLVTEDIRRAADTLISDLGFPLPPEDNPIKL